tara:strand:- start:533 stop:1477 length:945 start_codon:yes stop_codon:yes gene_type:complete
MKKKHFLVTGGAGFIGSNLVKKLISKGHKVTIFDNLSRGSFKKFKKSDNIKFINGDIRKITELKKAFKNIDCVCHLAYINGTKYFYSKPEIVIDVAINGLMNVINLSLKYKIKELILASSSEVYQKPTKIPTDENERLIIPNILNPRYSYGGGKILTELVGVIYGKKFFKKLIIFRPHNVYGPNMGEEHVIPTFIKKIKKIKNKGILKIQGSGTETRAFIYIDDFIEGLYKVISKGKHLNIYNIGNNEEIRIKYLANKIAKLMNKKIIFKYTPGLTGSTSRRCPDIKKIRKLGFKSVVNLDNGLRKTIEMTFKS